VRSEGIHLQRRRSWCISTDPEFVPKAADIVGLHLAPPENAVILCVDEKLSMAAEKGAIMAGRKGPAVWLRHGLWRRVQKPKSVVAYFRDPAWLPYGNFGCPVATPRASRIGVEAGIRGVITRS